jgi:hypothetical protein
VQTEFSDLSQVSIFALPRFDPEKEMRTLQNLWSKRNSGSGVPLIFRTEPQEPITEQLSDTSIERSYFESDSDSDEDEYAKRFVLRDRTDLRKPWKIARRSGRTSFSALRRALTGSDRLGFRDFPTIESTFPSWEC